MKPKYQICQSSAKGPVCKSSFLSLYKCQTFLTDAGKELPEKRTSERTLGDNIVQAPHLIQEDAEAKRDLEAYPRPRSQETVDQGLHGPTPLLSSRMLLSMTQGQQQCPADLSEHLQNLKSKWD